MYFRAVFYFPKRHKIGVYSTIIFVWDNTLKTLTIGNGNGEFPGMLKNRKFEIVLVNENSGVGIEVSKISKTISYSGKTIVVKL